MALKFAGALVGCLSLVSGAELMSTNYARALHAAKQLGVIPPNTLTHFCMITSWAAYNSTLDTFAGFLGVEPPVPGIAGGLSSNGTYLGKRLVGTTLIAFLQLNNLTRMEFLAGEPSQPSWWRDVYLKKGFEVHHMGYDLPQGSPIWPAVTSFTAAGLGPAVQWGRWGDLGTAGSGCYVYMDSQATLGVTTEILASVHDCDTLPDPPAGV